MIDKSAIAPWVKRFLLEYLPGERNFTRNTQQSYRDAIRLLIIFAVASLRKKADQLLIEDITADLVRKFMRHIEEVRKCGVSTRNQRLAAVHALATFIGERSPEHLAWCAGIRAINFKRCSRVPVGYLERKLLVALLTQKLIRTGRNISPKGARLRLRQPPSRWREFCFALHQIQQANEPPGALQQTLANWNEIARELAENPRGRLPQLVSGHRIPQIEWALIHKRRNSQFILQEGFRG